MIDSEQAEHLLDDRGHVFAGDNTDLGPVARVFVDEYTNWPSFVTIASPTPGLETFIALHEAELRADGIWVPYPPAKIEQAPRVDIGQDLSITEENALFDYYDVPIEGVVPSVAHLGAAIEPNGKFDQVSSTSD